MVFIGHVLVGGLKLGLDVSDSELVQEDVSDVIRRDRDESETHFGSCAAGVFGDDRLRS